MSERRAEELFDGNRSVWASHREPPGMRPVLSGDRAADVVIVGGGLTGISTAWHLRERHPELGIVLLEGARLGSGGSGRNGGLLLNWRKSLLGLPPEVALARYRATLEGIETVGEMLRAADAEHLWRRGGSMDLFTSPRAAEGTARECQEMQAAGIPFEFLGPAEVRERLEVEHVHGARFDPNAGQLDGLGFVEAMAPLLEERGVEIFEGTLVTRIREGRTVEVRTPGGTVRASALVLATNAYTPWLGYFRSSIIPVHSHVVASAPRPTDEWAELGWRQPCGFDDDSGRVAYGCLSPQGELVFGGGSNLAYEYLYGGRTAYRGEAARPTAAVRTKLLHYLPWLRDMELPHVWTGPVGLTLTRMCCIGVMGEHRNVYYGLGYSGNGLALSTLAGKVLRDIHSGDDERWRELPFYCRRPLPTPPEPLRWIGYQAYTRLTGRSPSRILRPRS